MKKKSNNVLKHKRKLTERDERRKSKNVGDKESDEKFAHTHKINGTLSEEDSNRCYKALNIIDKDGVRRSRSVHASIDKLGRMRDSKYDIEDELESHTSNAPNNNSAPEERRNWERKYDSLSSTKRKLEDDIKKQEREVDYEFSNQERAVKNFDRNYDALNRNMRHHPERYGLPTKKDIRKKNKQQPYNCSAGIFESVEII